MHTYCQTLQSMTTAYRHDIAPGATVTFGASATLPGDMLSEAFICVHGVYYCTLGIQALPFTHSFFFTARWRSHLRGLDPFRCMYILTSVSVATGICYTHNTCTCRPCLARFSPVTIQLPLTAEQNMFRVECLLYGRGEELLPLKGGVTSVMSNNRTLSISAVAGIFKCPH